MRTLTCPLRDTSLVLFSRFSGHFVQNPDSHGIKPHVDENQETILQLGANRRIFLLAAGSFSVHETTLETLCLHIYILFHMFRNKTFFFYRTPLLQTLAITDIKSPPEGVRNDRSRLYSQHELLKLQLNQCGVQYTCTYALYTAQ